MGDAFNTVAARVTVTVIGASVTLSRTLSGRTGSWAFRDMARSRRGGTLIRKNMAE
jgi:hypothetical protein